MVDSLDLSAPNDSDPPDVFFAKLERLDQEFRDSFTGLPASDIYGLVNAMGSGGSGRRSGQWDLVIHIAGWKHAGSALRTGELRLEMLVSKEDLRRWMDEIRPYTILHARGHVGSHPRFGSKAVATEIVSVSCRDAELEALAADLQKPVIFEDPALGTFTLKRDYNWFECDSLWQGQNVRLRLDVGEALETKECLEVARTLWRDQDEWAKKVDDAMMAELLELREGGWCGEDDKDAAPEDLKKRIPLGSIGVTPDGRFDFWYDDHIDDLLGGHSIRVSGNLQKGVGDASLEG